MIIFVQRYKFLFIHRIKQEKSSPFYILYPQIIGDNTILQSAFFRITKVIPVELAVGKMKAAALKSCYILIFFNLDVIAPRFLPNISQSSEMLLPETDNCRRLSSSSFVHGR